MQSLASLAGILRDQVIGIFQEQAGRVDVLDDAVVQLAADPPPVGGQDALLFHVGDQVVGLDLEYLQEADDKEGHGQPAH